MSLMVMIVYDCFPESLVFLLFIHPFHRILHGLSCVVSSSRFSIIVFHLSITREVQVGRALFRLCSATCRPFCVYGTFVTSDDRVSFSAQGTTCATWHMSSPLLSLDFLLFLEIHAFLFACSSHSDEMHPCELCASTPGPRTSRYDFSNLTVHRPAFCFQVSNFSNFVYCVLFFWGYTAYGLSKFAFSGVLLHFTIFSARHGPLTSATIQLVAISSAVFRSRRATFGGPCMYYVLPSWR